MASKVIESNIKTELNDKQKRFCEEYLKDLNGTRAYKQVYECDYEVANVNASRMLVKASVKKYINDLIEEYGENVDITIAEIVAELKKIAKDNKARKSDKIKALELLGKYKQMFIEKKEITLNDTKIDMSIEEIDKQLKELGYNK